MKGPDSRNWLASVHESILNNSTCEGELVGGFDDKDLIPFRHDFTNIIKTFVLFF